MLKEDSSQSSPEKSVHDNTDRSSDSPRLNHLVKAKSHSHCQSVASHHSEAFQDEVVECSDHDDDIIDVRSMVPSSPGTRQSTDENSGSDSEDKVGRDFVCDL